ncbi:tyrosinase family oxidase copper chaperone [Actinoplanes sp. NPDC049668]|uniref:tyrosinase family oxidase copper chaperone n=1 Tax=unclassified Actinoplanes TaxID=2626549 RepID=UPI0033B55429
MNRRELLKLTAAGAVAVGTGALGVQVLTAGDPAVAAADSGERFDETYRGRRIQGAAVPAARARALADGGAGTAAMPDVVIDGAALHVMVNADGTYTSVANHYQTFRTLREVARAAVDELDGARLVHVRHR